LLFRFGSAIRAIPFTWEIENPVSLINSLTVLPISKQILWYIILVLYQFVYTAFIYWGFYAYYPSYTLAKDVGPAVMHLVWVCGHSLCSAMFFHELLCKNSTVYTVNQLIDFVTQSMRK
jgi:hypothetical protein